MRRPSAKEIIFWVTIVPKVVELLAPYFKKWFGKEDKKDNKKDKKKNG